jgi:hypothetical protein
MSTDDMPYVVETDDDAILLSTVYPLHDVAGLDEATEHQLAEATRKAMRGLVAGEWEKRGHAVRWVNDPSEQRNAEDLLRSYGYTVAPLAYGNPENDRAPIAEEQVAVWGDAYDALDADALWQSVHP